MYYCVNRLFVSRQGDYVFVSICWFVLPSVSEIMPAQEVDEFS